MATSFRTLREYLSQESKTFVVPNYQRGYKWAVKTPAGESSAVEVLLDNLIGAYKNNVQSYFIQGITVCEEDNNKIVLIDGQQRTTTLYLLLWCLKWDGFVNFKLKYDIREESQKFIARFHENDFEPGQPQANDPQDIYYFKEAIQQIRAKLKGEDEKWKNEFCKYILDQVSILYIPIEKSKATKTFTMMNGSKATMLQEELIKAEILRKVSLPDTAKKDVSTSVNDKLDELKEIIAKDWETNALRSRYAREWDKWLYWWNREEVKEFFGVESPMGFLLEYYFQTDHKEDFNFNNFRNLIEDKKSTKNKFKELRDLQKSFEDIFSIAKIHNYLKMALICSNRKDDKFDIINYFIEKKNDSDIKDDYSKWRLVGATHLEITDPDKSTSKETKEDKAQNALDQLSAKFVYKECKDLALKQLLRLNVEVDNQLNGGNGRKFDFSIYDNQSLEHIHPKSKTYHKEEDEYYDGNGVLLHNKPQGNEWLNRDEFDENESEHCIGNLVLLDKGENAKFSDKPFEEKKKKYFDVTEIFKSRNLLHTISVFAKSQWGKEDIHKNQEEFIERFKQDYNL